MLSTQAAVDITNFFPSLTHNTSCSCNTHYPLSLTPANGRSMQHACRCVSYSVSSCLLEVSVTRWHSPRSAVRPETKACPQRVSCERSGTRRWGAASMLMPRATVAAKAREAALAAHALGVATARGFGARRGRRAREALEQPRDGLWRGRCMREGQGESRRWLAEVRCDGWQRGEACLAVGPEVGRLLDAALEHAVGDVAAHGPKATLHLGHLDDLLDLGHVLHLAPITAWVLEREEEDGVASLLKRGRSHESHLVI